MSQSKDLAADLPKKGGRKVLTAKQEAFCQAYIETGIASEAYRRTYSASRMKDKQVWEESSKLMSIPMVAQRVAELRSVVTDKACKKLAISKEWVLEQLVENVEMAKAATPVLDAEGNPAGEYKQNLAAGNKALELIGKELGMFVERREVRTGSLDDIPYEEKVASLTAVREAIRRAKEIA
jgi:hypothetical protein